MWFVKPLLSVRRFVISIFAFVVSRRILVSNNDIINLMTPQDWAALILSIASIFAIVAGGIKWLVKHYLNELKPNSGSSLKDAKRSGRITQRLKSQNRPYVRYLD
jgi:hypothetical protein